MSDTSIKPFRFVKHSLEEIIKEIISNINSTMERANTSPSQYLYQLIKIVALRELEMEENMEYISSLVSIPECVGQGLDRWGIECGIPRKSAQFATGSVQLTMPPADTVIPKGSLFSTNNGIDYATNSAVNITTIIEMTRDTDDTDVIPTPYSNVAAIEWCNSSASRNGEEYEEGTDFNFANDTITWISDHKPPTGSIYFIKVATSYTVTVDVTCVYSGIEGNVAPGSITINSSGISNITSVTNATQTSGGADVEDDEAYRVRLLAAKRRNFTLERIASIVNGVQGVRNVAVRQDVAVDQSVVSNWDILSGNSVPIFPNIAVEPSTIMQTFVPGDDIVSLRGVTLYGKKIGNAPDLKISLHYYSSGQATSDLTPALADGRFDPDNLDPDHPTAVQDLYIPIKYGGFDNTRTYALLISQSGATTSAYWQLRYYSGYDPDPENPWRGQLFVDYSGTTNPTDYDLAFKTHFGGASYTVQTAIEQNADWDEVKEEIEGLLDYEEGEGFSPVGIQYNVVRADEVYVYVQSKLYIEKLYDFATIASNIEANINTYVNSLKAGESVVWSKIMGIIMSEPGVKKATETYIKRPETDWGQVDVPIADGEIAVFSPSTSGTTKFTLGGYM